MPEVREVRKELWDYLENIGVKLTIGQHNKIKNIIAKHAMVTNQHLHRQINEMIQARKAEKDAQRERQRMGLRR